ncbi:exported protein of unknown function [Ralstonia solanacearum CMR15]|nr:exported protein of unknown function [Ralstonia solanacearum CMR15]
MPRKEPKAILAALPLLLFPGGQWKGLVPAKHSIAIALCALR